MTILDYIVGYRVLVGEPGGPNLLSTLVHATKVGINVRFPGRDYNFYFPWSNVRNFLVAGNFAGGQRVVCLSNVELLGTVHSVSSHWLEVQPDPSPHLCGLPPPGLRCTCLAGHSGSCPTYTVGQGLLVDPSHWSRVVYRPEGLDDYLFEDPTPRIRTRFEIMEDL